MTKFYVKYEQVQLWHGYIEAPNIEVAHQIAEQLTHEQLDKMVTIKIPTHLVALTEDKDSQLLYGVVEDISVI